MAYANDNNADYNSFTTVIAAPVIKLELTVVRIVARLIANAHAHLTKMRAISDLEKLSDAQLQDIGLARGEIAHFVETHSTK